jgi:conjugal transfer/entry exclusion protein
MHNLTNLIFVFVLLEIQFSDITAVIGVVSSAVIAISVVTGVVWFVWKGKDIQQLQADVARKDNIIKDLNAEISEARGKKSEALEEKAEALAELNGVKAELKQTEGKLQRSLEREEECEKEKLRLIGEAGRK